MSEELIYLYRRKGNESWATCDADRYSDLAGNHFFEVRVARHQHDYAALEAECDHLKACQENAQLHITGLVAARNAALKQRDTLAGLLERARGCIDAMGWDDLETDIDTALAEIKP